MPSSSLIHQACSFLEKGHLVVIPTETVYGLAADASNENAVLKIYELKKRPQFNPLIFHVYSIKQAKSLAFFPDIALKTANHFWNKGRPLTLVLKKSLSNLSSIATAGLDTIAIRRPNHALCLKLLETFNRPLVAPSANYSTTISPTSSQCVKDSFKEKTPFIVEGGPCVIGLESTILDLTSDKPTLLRPGGVTKEELETFFQIPILENRDPVIKSPGLMRRHYSPDKPLRLNALSAKAGEVLIGFGPLAPIGTWRNLSPTGNVKEAAQNLFKTLRDSDALEGFKGIAIMPIPNEGLGFAINDRLIRAATKD